MNTVKCNSTWPVFQAVAVTVQLSTNYLLYLNRTALFAHSLHSRTLLSAPVPGLWSSPLPLLYNYQPTARCISTEQHCTPTHHKEEQLYVHQDLNCGPAHCRYCTNTNKFPVVSQQYCTLHQFTTQMNTVKFKCTWSEIQAVAVTVQLPTYCLLYLNWTAQNTYSPNRRTPLSEPVPEIWSSPVPLL